MSDQHKTHQPNDEPQLPAELAALERELARMSPAAPRLDRDRLMFEAGRASADQNGRAKYSAGPFWSGSRVWPIATAAMTAATLALSATLILQSRSDGDRRIVENIDVPPAPAVPEMQLVAVEPLDAIPLPTPISLPAGGYLAIRQIALTQGVAALDRAADWANRGDSPRDAAVPPPATARELLNELLPDLARPAGFRS